MTNRNSLYTALLSKGLKCAFIALLAGAQFGCSWLPEKEKTLDCPLRDKPYSVDTPMMDLMGNQIVINTLEQEVPALMKRVPPLFKATEAPSLSAIMTLRGVMDLLYMPMDEASLKNLDDKLQAITIDAEARQYRCARYDNTEPSLTLSEHDKQILIFNKVTGFDHGDATVAAGDAVVQLAEQQGWGVTSTDKGGVFNQKSLARFDVVVWNNVSGDVLTLSQRDAFKSYIESGGAFLGIHGSGGDFVYLWDWYRDELLGAQFIGHTMNPHYQDALVRPEQSKSGIANKHLSAWHLYEEWYSFSENPRDKGADVVATVDEQSYEPVMGGVSLRMGEDHPIAWTRCVNNGRSFYTATGHLPESYQNGDNMALLREALVWTVGEGATNCVDGQYEKNH